MKFRITLNLKEAYGDGYRWKVGLNTVPCIKVRKRKRCSFCGFKNWKDPVPPQKVGKYFSDFFKKNYTQDISRVEIYCSGSFFDDSEVSRNSRTEIIKILNQSSIKKIVLESRTEFISLKKLSDLIKYINPKKLIIAVGLETTNDAYRRKLAKGLAKNQFIKSFEIIQELGMGFQAYLLLKPPVIRNDREAIIDLVKSVKELISITKNKESNLTVAIQPFFVVENSSVAKDPYFRNEFRPVWLYTIAKSIEILDKIRKEQGLDFKIILGNYNDNVETISIPSNYNKQGGICACSEKIREYLKNINCYPQNVRVITDEVLNSKCNCKKSWIKDVGSKLKNFD